MNTNNQKTKFGKTIYILIAFGLLLAFVVLVLEKQQVINLYQKPISGQPQSRPVNDVNYSPPTAQEEQQAQDTKKQLLEQNQNVQPIPADTINVSLSAATQDVPGGPLEVRAIIDGATTGTCTLNLSQNGNIKTFTANVVNLGTYYSCEGFSVPVASLGAGNWQLELLVANQNAKGSVTQKVTINL